MALYRETKINKHKKSEVYSINDYYFYKCTEIIITIIIIIIINMEINRSSCSFTHELYTYTYKEEWFIMPRLLDRHWMSLERH